MKSSSPYVAVVHLKINCDWLVCQILDCIIIRNKSPVCIKGKPLIRLVCKSVILQPPIEKSHITQSTKNA
jgi:hypothetical protein